MQVDSVAENLFFTTVRIDTVAIDGSQGSGTGFLYTHKISESQHAIFVVTNKHVVNGMRSGSLTFHQMKDEKPNLGSGFRLDIQDWSQAWFGHPKPDVDIAIVPFLPLEAHIKQQNAVDLFYRSVAPSVTIVVRSLEETNSIH